MRHSVEEMKVLISKGPTSLLERYYRSASDVFLIKFVPMCGLITQRRLHPTLLSMNADPHNVSATNLVDTVWDITSLDAASKGQRAIRDHLNIAHTVIRKRSGWTQARCAQGAPATRLLLLKFRSCRQPLITTKL